MARSTSAAPGAVASWRAEPQPSAIHLDRRHLAGWQWTEKEFNYGIDLGIGMELLGDDELAFTFGYQSAPQGGGGDAGGTLGVTQHFALSAARIRNSTGGTQHAIHPLPGSRGRRPVHGGLLQLHQRKRWRAGARRCAAAPPRRRRASVPSRSCSACWPVCGRLARRSRKATCNWSTTASASSARWTGHASRSWPTWSPAASRSGSTRTAWTASRRWASACRCWSRPPGGCSGAPAGARRLVPESLAGAAQKVLRELVGDLRLE